MNLRHFSASSMLVAGALVTVALQGAAQGQAPPAGNQTPPLPPAAAQPTPPAPPPPAPGQTTPPGNTTPPAPGPGASAEPPHASPAVTHANVNLRNGPGTTYTVVVLIPAGASVEVSGCDKGWCQVAYNGQNGYIIETSIAPGGPGPARRPGPPPGYAGPPGAPPPGYAGPPPGYYPPPPGYYPPPYYYGGPYYGPYWGWRGGYYRRW